MSGKSSGKGILIAIIIIALVVGFGSCAGKQSRRDESSRFQQQMGKDPATWSKDEKNRYNNFIEWSDKQK